MPQIEFTVSYENVDRDVTIFVPSRYVPGARLPLVFALHGGGGDASVMYARDKRIVSHAESDGFLAVFPNGLPRAPGETNYHWEDEVNISYMNFLIDDMMARYSVDSSRIYFLGFSGGAQLIYRLAADADISMRIGGIGTVAGEIGGRRIEPPLSDWEVIDPSATPGVPMPAYLVQGGSDERLPAAGGFDDDREKIIVGFETKVAIWRHFTGALAETTHAATPALPPRVIARKWENAQSRHAVVSILDPTLHHHWPRWDVMEDMWSFFLLMPARVP